MINFNEFVKIDGRNVYYREKNVGHLEPDFESGSIFVTFRKYPEHWLIKKSALGFSIPVLEKVQAHGAKFLGIIFAYKGKTRKFRYSMDEVNTWEIYDGREHGDDLQRLLVFDPEMQEYEWKPA